MSECDVRWPAIFIVHLYGGLRAICSQDKGLLFEPISSSQTSLCLNVADYRTIYHELELLGVTIVGVDFISNAWEAKGFVPPEWRSYHRSGMSRWPCTESAMRWSHIGHAAYKRKLGRLWDIASRISQQINICSWRLRQFSEAYHDQLCGLCGRQQFRNDTRVLDLFTPIIYSNLQAVLVDACILRDYLAEFAFWFIFKPRGNQTLENVTSFGKLFTKILKPSQENDLVTTTLKQAGERDGWLAELGEYRNLVVHVSLLAAVNRTLQVHCRSINLTKSADLPTIRCPIPSKPARVIEVREDKGFFGDFEKLVEVLLRSDEDMATSRDGLEYAHESIGKLSLLSDLLSVESPIAPEIPDIKSTDFC